MSLVYPRSNLLTLHQQICRLIQTYIKVATLVAAENATPTRKPICFLPRDSFSTTPTSAGLLLLLWAPGSEVKIFNQSQGMAFPSEMIARSEERWGYTIEESAAQASSEEVAVLYRGGL